jgi:Short-chain alcohol dehydrogenase of unknown specificity
MGLEEKKLVIVTGAARGIGLATSKLFLQNNFKVAMVDKDEEELNKINIHNPNYKTFTFDISDVDKNSIMIEEIINWGKRIDVLVNNAGIADFGKIETVNYNSWRKIMETEFRWIFFNYSKLVLNI